MGGGPEVPHLRSPQGQGLGSEARAKPQSKKEFTVLVTGMGPFPDGQGGRYAADDNTSHLVTKLLPTILPATHKSNPTSLPIRILNPSAPTGKYVKTEYAYIRTYIQAMYDEYGDELDAVVHLGMADGWEWYSVEERAFNERFTSSWWSTRYGEEEKEGYYLFPDDAGKTVRDISGRGKGIWDEMPMGLESRVNVGKVVRDVVSVLNDESETSVQGGEKLKVDVIPHFEAGFYGCGFIYYESLATCRERGLHTKSSFAISRVGNLLSVLKEALMSLQ
ncbi:hypothetical protein B7494_g3944 [Chlorociboria aeruginascens]|nr:hypothetical protein B7494_g3944 [Chlorociboria aeruginascens]